MDKCAFHLVGEEGVWASGFMATDHFRVSNDVLQQDYLFGCTHITRSFNNKGFAAGVLALGRAPTSLVTRAAARGLTNFSCCRSGETSNRSFLQFGANIPHRTTRYQTTWILPPQDAHDSAYHAKLIGISLNERRLDGVLPEMFASRKDGQGGCIVDLGTPLTTMAQEVSGTEIGDGMRMQLRQSYRRSNEDQPSIIHPMAYLLSSSLHVFTVPFTL